MPACKEDSTGKNIYDLMDKELSRNKIPWENCVAFGADNASVMLGQKKGVAAFVTHKNPSIHIVGCLCHMLHNTAKKTATALPVSMDEFLIDIYYYLDKSKKWIQGVKTLQKLCDKPTRKINKHCVTRWLSLGTCLERLIEQWEPLSRYFREEMRRTQMKRIHKVVKKPTFSAPKAKAKSTKSSSSASKSTASLARNVTKSSEKPTRCSTSTAKALPHSTPSEPSSPKASVQTAASISKSSPSATQATSSGIGTLPSSADRTKPTASVGPKPSLAFSTALDNASSKSKAISATPKPTSKSKPKPSGASTAKSKIGTASVSKQTSVSRPGAASPLKRRLHSTPAVGSKAKQKRPNVATRKASSGDKPKTPAKLQETRLSRANRLFVSPQTKLYCFFLNYANKVFETGNLLLQREEPCVHILHRKLNGLLKDVLSRFVKPAVIKETPCTEVEYQNEENQKKDSDLMVGNSAREYIKNAIESRSDTDADRDNDLSDEDIQVFYGSVRNFYIKACDYILKTWPLKVDLLQHAEILDISLREEVSFASLKFFVDKYPCLLSNASIDDLEDEFVSYQVDDTVTKIDLHVRVDKQWDEISKIKDPGTGGLKYPLLSKCMKGILVIPHSNAMCERAFSTVRKNKTEFRPNMSLKTEAIMIEKMAHGGTICHQRVYTDTTIRRAKRATYQSLHTSGSKQ